MRRGVAPSSKSSFAFLRLRDCLTRHESLQKRACPPDLRRFRKSKKDKTTGSTQAKNEEIGLRDLAPLWLKLPFLTRCWAMR